MHELKKEIIEELFVEQMRDLTFKTNKALRSIDMQFSDIVI
tara:strand:- start:943 stop:1065 length:123 start_codon:yes stop_codon:yes gene_type:complete